MTSKPEVTALEVAQAAGATPILLEVRLPNGELFNLLGPSGGAKNLEKQYRAREQQGDPYATNVFFQPGAAGPLIGLANRLTGWKVRPGVLEARVLDIPICAPVNHGHGPGQIPHHLHGVGFDKPTQISIQSDHHGIQIRGDFEPGFHQPFWCGSFSARAMHSLHDGLYEFDLQIKNEGKTEIPMGAGAHPYFWAVSQDPDAIAIRVPGHKIVEIDNYENVLPTGRLLDLEPGSDLDFSAPEGRLLKDLYLDNIWVDLETNPEGFAFVEFLDRAAGVGFRMTATTKNIRGVQVFSPRPTDFPELGVFASLELVTNLPDPRDELWQEIPTGMVRLQSGESLRYGYRIEPFEIPVTNSQRTSSANRF